ncbi:MAG: hypothetical protein SPL05_07255 [Eubacteriales bacterium]|nr:hypothetical protein [Eubacteriales bacterium]
MKITDDAKLVIAEALKEQNCDSVALSIKETEHGYGLAMELVTKKEDDRAIDVNGVQVVMDMETEMALLATTFDAENGELVLKNEGHSCGSGGCAGCSGCH